MPNLNYLPAELVNLIIDHLRGQTAFACLAPTTECASNGSTPYLDVERTLEREGTCNLSDAFNIEGDVRSRTRPAEALEMLTGGLNIYFTLPNHYSICMGMANGQWADASLNHPDHPGACVLQMHAVLGATRRPDPMAQLSLKACATTSAQIVPSALSTKSTTTSISPLP